MRVMDRLLFFLEGVERVAAFGVESLRRVVALEREWREVVWRDGGRGAGSCWRVVEFAFRNPVFDVGMAGRELGLSHVTVGKGVDFLVGCGALVQVGGGRRGRVFRFSPYLAVFEREFD